jgi:hypothetical protein
LMLPNSIPASIAIGSIDPAFVGSNYRQDSTYKSHSSRHSASRFHMLELA